MDFWKQNNSALILSQVPRYSALLSNSPGIMLLAMMNKQQRFFRWKTRRQWNKRCLASSVSKLTWSPRPVCGWVWPPFRAARTAHSQSFPYSMKNSVSLPWESLNFPRMIELLRPTGWGEVFKKWRRVTERNTERGGNFHLCVSRRSSISEKPWSAESLLRWLDFENCNDDLQLYLHSYCN